MKLNWYHGLKIHGFGDLRSLQDHISHSRGESRWSPTATKTFLAIFECSGKSSKPNSTFNIRGKSSCPQTPYPAPTLPKGWGVLLRRIKKMQSPTREFEKTACASHKKSKDFQFTKAARTELKEPPALWHYSHSWLPLSNTAQGNPPPVFLAAVQLLCFSDTISPTLCACVTLIKATGKVQGRVLQPLFYKHVRHKRF